MGENKAEKKEVRIMYLEKIERIIGASVDPNEEGKFASFREVDELTRSRVREIYYKLDELRAKSYLKYFLPKNIDDEGHLFSFLFDVVIDGMDQNEWEKEKGVKLKKP